VSRSRWADIMRAPEQIAAFALGHLQEILSSSGEILYSGVSTLRPGEVYLLGHNPGGNPNDRRLPTVRRSIKELPTKSYNSYLDTRWSGRKQVGQAPLQLRVVWLLDQLGLKPRDVAASNLIFCRSRDVAGSQFLALARTCWPVHERLLSVVQPRLVIAYGNSGQSPYRFLADVFGAGSEECVSSGHGSWKCRTFVVPGRFRVVGVPHLSRYDIRAHETIARWIRRLPRPRRAAQHPHAAGGGRERMSRRG
jgi:uracil-DNA glycosylase